jgi:hypothetical protein
MVTEAKLACFLLRTRVAVVPTAVVDEDLFGASGEALRQPPQPLEERGERVLLVVYGNDDRVVGAPWSRKRQPARGIEPPREASLWRAVERWA